jgi:hypothetical protein
VAIEILKNVLSGLSKVRAKVHEAKTKAESAISLIDKAKGEVGQLLVKVEKAKSAAEALEKERALVLSDAQAKLLSQVKAVVADAFSLADRSINAARKSGNDESIEKAVEARSKASKALSLIDIGDSSEALLFCVESKILAEQSRYLSMPVEARLEIESWKSLSKSSDSMSFYDRKKIPWPMIPKGTKRLSDHWNFSGKGWRFGKGAKLSFTDRELNDTWILAEYRDGVWYPIRMYSDVEDDLGADVS